MVREDTTHREGIGGRISHSATDVSAEDANDSKRNAREASETCALQEL